MPCPLAHPSLRRAEVVRGKCRASYIQLEKVMRELLRPSGDENTKHSWPLPVAPKGLGGLGKGTSGLVIIVSSSPWEAKGVCPQSARADLSAQERWGVEASRLLAGEATVL